LAPDPIRVPIAFGLRWGLTSGQAAPGAWFTCPIALEIFIVLVIGFVSPAPP
jgi:hypothetical protein